MSEFSFWDIVFAFIFTIAYLFPVTMCFYTIIRYKLKYFADCAKKDKGYLILVPIGLVGILIPLVNWAVLSSLLEDKNGLPLRDYYGAQKVDEDKIFKTALSDLVIISPMFIIGAMFYFL